MRSATALRQVRSPPPCMPAIALRGNSTTQKATRSDSAANCHSRLSTLRGRPSSLKFWFQAQERRLEIPVTQKRQPCNDRQDADSVESPRDRKAVQMTDVCTVYGFGQVVNQFVINVETIAYQAKETQHAPIENSRNETFRLQRQDQYRTEHDRKYRVTDLNHPRVGES